ncbi:MAG: hypothetical protein IPP10_10185 [Candidatus Competibacteraceae bacterium]|nr:hypothetical protein [Candidatus Competibacteraceae bacterium]MBK7982597.1 hypothetical protein [Candidatus Competibacteraceae bacterium]MBK8898857.1 hypothetical protein [Candidatus Competibacteraceae bacterium]MBK8963996.1 hypothetical protein [Candidatus Competibacteraceae bacterium]MBK9951861.1 hypothetical protein [Candidatus Competibacteraceae bacterium]
MKRPAADGGQNREENERAGFFQGLACIGWRWSDRWIGAATFPSGLWS